MNEKEPKKVVKKVAPAGNKKITNPAEEIKIPKKRGPKPKVKSEAEVKVPQKRGPKPKAKPETEVIVPKKRGRKPKTIASNPAAVLNDDVKQNSTEVIAQVENTEAFTETIRGIDTPPLEKTKNEQKNNLEIQKKRTRPPVFKTPEVIVLLILTAVIGLSMGILLCRPILKQQESERLNEVLNDSIMKEFLNNYQYVIDNYYGKIDKKELLDGAIEGMVNALGDEHSGFIDKDEDSNFNLSLQGSYDGLGIQITNRLLDDKTYGNIYITKVFTDSPADKAGIKANDEVLAIDGKDMKGKNFKELSSYIKDSKSKTFKIIVSREEKEHTVTVSKANVDIQSVFSKVIEKNNKKIGYLRINIFALNSDDQFEDELESLEESGINSLIIDVRDNAGGHLKTVSAMLSELLDKSHIIYQTQNGEGVKKFYSEGKTTKKYPIVVLINENSASASEVLAGALSEEYGATLLGTKTYGKGTVQQLVTLSDENEYKFTTKNWLTPKGIWVHGIGIKPDVELKINDAYFERPSDETDNQLQKALEILASK